jgi:glycosyltransferase involved in cell wall biosynthesis
MKENKRVLYITYDGMTDQLGQSQVIPYLEILAARGYVITLISAEKKEKLSRDKHIIEKKLKRAGIHWHPIKFTRKPMFIAKIYDQWKLNRKVISLNKAEKFDFVHCRSYVPVEAALKLYTRFRTPYLFDMRGFWVDERVDNGQWDLNKFVFRQLYKLYKKKEKMYFDKAAHIISLTQKGKEELINTFHIPNTKISVIPCCADLQHFNYERISETDIQKTRESLNIQPTSTVLMYLGSLGGWYLTNEMLDFFKILQKKEATSVFLFITHDNKQDILKNASSKGINPDSIRVLPASRLEVPLLMSVADCSIFFIKDAYSKKASSPTKQGEIMAMGIPVVCNDIGDTGVITKQSNSGVLIRSFDEIEYQKAIEQICGHNNFDKRSIRKSAFTYYDLHTAGQKYTEIYHELSILKAY